MRSLATSLPRSSSKRSAPRLALRLDDVVARAPGGGAQFGVVVRTFRGVVDGIEEEDEEGLNPAEHEVQVRATGQ